MLLRGNPKRLPARSFAMPNFAVYLINPIIQAVVLRQVPRESPILLLELELQGWTAPSSLRHSMSRLNPIKQSFDRTGLQGHCKEELVAAIILSRAAS